MFEIYCQDAIDCMKSLESGSVDLIIADPPYFQIKGEFDFVWKSVGEYLAWSKEWLLEAKRILKDSGTLIFVGRSGTKALDFRTISHNDRG